MILSFELDNSDTLTFLSTICFKIKRKLNFNLLMQLHANNKYNEYASNARRKNAWSHGVMVSTLDSESSDPSSNLGGTYRYFFLFLSVLIVIIHN